MNKIFDVFFDSTKYSILTQTRTGNVFYDTLITTAIISIFTYLYNYIYEIKGIKFLNSIISLFYKKNCIILEGKKCSVVSNYSHEQKISVSYSDRFKAILDYIVKNIDNQKSIYQLKEFYHNIIDNKKNGNKTIGDILIVNQYKKFTIDDKIFYEIICEREDESNNNDKQEKMNAKTDIITIKIYSYDLALLEIKNYIDNITNIYLKTIKDCRSNKRFIYSLNNTKLSSNDDDDESYTLNNRWKEDVFESAKTFKNLFFDGKKKLKDTIDFFRDNKAWYYDKGIKYTLGIGLMGPPGTGKTSLIKAIANYLDCHIIILSLKLVKTKRQLDNFFFENKYNSKNDNDSISFDKKIIVMEDIDCIGDIILDRSKKNADVTDSNKSMNSSDNIKLGDVIRSVVEVSNDDNAKIFSKLSDEEPITLDDILNVFDGIRETPGRILIISSNHYEKLDPALIRPGRIDVTLELTKASHNTISELYKHLFNKEIDAEKLANVKEFYYSPAELINIYISNKDEDEFINHLL
jgi:DNA replication protein DnaC